MSMQENITSTPDGDYQKKYADLKLSMSLEANVETIKNIFSNDDTLVVTKFTNQTNTLESSIVFIDGMVDSTDISKFIIQPIIKNEQLAPLEDKLDYVKKKVIFSGETKRTAYLINIIEAIVVGDTVLFINYCDEALIINTKKWETRAVDEPEGEKVLRGPREGFTESLITNLSLIRRKLFTPDLKFVFRQLGTRSHTRLCICYLDGID